MRALAFCAGPAALSGIAPPVEKVALPPAVAWLALAKRAITAGDVNDALRCFEGAVAHEPRLAVAHLGRAVCLAELEREDEAGDALSATLDLSRGQEEVLYHLARMCAQHGQTALAMPLLHEAVRASPAMAMRVREDALFADHPAYLAVVGRL